MNCGDPTGRDRWDEEGGTLDLDPDMQVRSPAGGIYDDITQTPRPL